MAVAAEVVPLVFVDASCRQLVAEEGHVNVNVILSRLIYVDVDINVDRDIYYLFNIYVTAIRRRRKMACIFSSFNLIVILFPFTICSALSPALINFPKF